MDPDAALRLALDRAYETFGTYPQPVELNASPVHDPAELRPLTTKRLGHLSVDDLAGYSMSALTTIGEVEDYKHFLPRILELTVGSGVLDPETIALKLRYGHWDEWRPQEKIAVSDVFREACIQAFNEHTDEYLADSWFCGMAILGLDVQSIMRTWEAATSSNAALQLAQLFTTLLFRNHVDEMGYWGKVQAEVVQAVRAWLLSGKIHARLMSSRLAIKSNDIWILDRALVERDILLGQQVQ